MKIRNRLRFQKISVALHMNLPASEAEQPTVKRLLTRTALLELFLEDRNLREDYANWINAQIHIDEMQNAVGEN